MNRFRSPWPKGWPYRPYAKPSYRPFQERPRKELLGKLKEAARRRRGLPPERVIDCDEFLENAMYPDRSPAEKAHLHIRLRMRDFRHIHGLQLSREPRRPVFLDRLHYWMARSITERVCHQSGHNWRLENPGAPEARQGWICDQCQSLAWGRKPGPYQYLSPRMPQGSVPWIRKAAV